MGAWRGGSAKNFDGLKGIAEHVDCIAMSASPFSTIRLGTRPLHSKHRLIATQTENPIEVFVLGGDFDCGHDSPPALQ